LPAARCSSLSAASPTLRRDADDAVILPISSPLLLTASFLASSSPAQAFGQLDGSLEVNIPGSMTASLAAIARHAAGFANRRGPHTGAIFTISSSPSPINPAATGA
jgi:hypothetical protein